MADRSVCVGAQILCAKPVDSCFTLFAQQNRAATNIPLFSIIPLHADQRMSFPEIIPAKGDQD